MYVSIKKKRYGYLQQSVRVGKKVKTHTIAYLGVVNAASLPIRLGAALMKPEVRERLFKSDAEILKGVEDRVVSRIEAAATRSANDAAKWEAANAREGQNSAPQSQGAEASSPSSSEGAQSSDQGDASGAA